MLCLALEGFFLHEVLRFKHHLSKEKTLGSMTKAWLERFELKARRKGFMSLD